jgi:GT2 family glycosyltransferase
MSDLVSIVMPVFEDGERAVSAIRSLLMQTLPDGMSMEILVVDDGSGDDTAGRILQVHDGRIELLRLGENRGRAEARNCGSRQARSPYLVFIDCDCTPATNNFLSEHIAALRADRVASTGPVTGYGGGFWDRYQRDASTRREAQFRRGCTFSGSSQNLAVLRSAFDEIGGFDAEFRNYGFEDRDLLLRLANVGEIAWTTGAAVSHLDSLALQDVCRKMLEGGEHSAGRFATLYPDEYRKLGYAAIDCRRRFWLRPVARLLGSRMPGVARLLEPALHKRWLPYPVRRGIARAASALSFMYGTLRAA